MSVIQMEYDSSLMFPAQGLGVLALKEKNGHRYLVRTVSISYLELLMAKLGGFTSPRPLTHDLIKNIVEILGASISHALITEVKDDMFCANLYLIDRRGKAIVIDCEPGDAFLICLSAQAPFFCEEKVLEECGMILDSENKFVGIREEKERQEGNEALKKGPFGQVIGGLDMSGLGS